MGSPEQKQKLAFELLKQNIYEADMMMKDINKFYNAVCNGFY